MNYHCVIQRHSESQRLFQRLIDPPMAHRQCHQPPTSRDLLVNQPSFLYSRHMSTYPTQSQRHLGVLQQCNGQSSPR